ncbi:hypothetical protein O181_080245 [Austropuccinia psidii MF-1]|uniref:Uncharacterized protein n=1 Tax=Austropuccinia psidii MF-1 TaxID=1389203 RepID=A0A9Q3FMV5_9BASI|nr:hypothetical protein [Austropuccinia psidii MF-1]
MISLRFAGKFLFQATSTLVLNETRESFVRSKTEERKPVFRIAEGLTVSASIAHSLQNAPNLISPGSLDAALGAWGVSERSENLARAAWRPSRDGTWPSKGWIYPTPPTETGLIEFQLGVEAGMACSWLAHGQGRPGITPTGPLSASPSSASPSKQLSCSNQRQASYKCSLIDLSETPSGTVPAESLEQLNFR